MVIKALRQGYRVGEIPSHEYRRNFGVSHIKLWKVAHAYIWSLVRNLI